MNLQNERGETLIELMVAIAIMTVVLGATLGIVRHMLDAGRQLAQRHADYAQIEALASAWETESRTAEAITVPSATCPEVEFFSRDPNGSVFHTWSYRWDASAKTVTRFASDSGALAPCTGGTGKVVATGVTAFSVTRRKASALTGAADAPYTAGGTTDATVPLGILEADGTTPVSAGNAFVEIAITGPQSQRTIDLLPGIAPSGYTLALTYACNARCSPGAPHDTSRVDQCASSYTVTNSYETQSTFYATGTQPSGVIPPASAPSQGFFFPTAWVISGQLTFTYSASSAGGDTAVAYDQFSITLPSDPTDPANEYYPSHVAPYDPVATADEIVNAYGLGVFTDPGVQQDITACMNMGQPVPVFHND